MLDIDDDGTMDESRYYRVTAVSNGSVFNQVGSITDDFTVIGKGHSFSYTVMVFSNGTTLFYNSERTVVSNHGEAQDGSSNYWKYDDYHDLFWCTMETGYHVSTVTV